jgi:acetyl-CoA C-acetyltransferase
MSGSVIVAGARTPIGRLLGGLKDKSAADLGGVAIKGALEKAGVSGDQVDYVILGQVIQAGAGQITARQAAVKGGIPMSVPSITINKVCLSGLNAIAMADQLIRLGEREIVVAGGMESMTQAPHLLPGSRTGFKYGDTKLVDSMAYDALWDMFTEQAMGALTETCNTDGLCLTREEQDAYAARSHQRAAEGWKNGLFDDEVVPVEIPAQHGKRVVVLRHLVRVFEPGVRYPEREVNALLAVWHPDVAALRRYLVDEGLLSRDAGRYWRSGGYGEV